MAVHMFPILKPLPPPSPSHPSESSQWTSPEDPVSCIEPGLVICFTCDSLHVLMPSSHIIPHSPSPTESKRLFLNICDCGSDRELLITKFRLKLKTIGKTARPFRYDLNQIPYNYKVEVSNRFKGLDLIDRVLDELWTEVRDIVQETGIKTIPRKKKCTKEK